MILKGFTVACCNLATLNMMMALGERETHPSFLFATLFRMSKQLSKQLLAPGGLSADCVQVSVM